jgi:hypothetical protein
MWSVCLECLISKLQNSPITFGFLKSSLITTTTLILTCAYPLLSPAQQSHLLGLALLEPHPFTPSDSPILFIKLLISLLPLLEIPAVHEHFAQIFAHVMSIMQAIQMGKDKLLNGQVLDSEESEYCHLKTLTRNKMADLD